MKKLLLIIAAIAYVAVSCEDKPKTLTDTDEPGTEQPGTNPADTCKISLITKLGGITPVAMVYRQSSSDVDFEKSINSIFKHFTITLNNGSLDTAIYTNVCDAYNYQFPSDSGLIGSVYQQSHFDSIKQGKYIIVIWQLAMGGYTWGTNHYDSSQTFFYRDIKLDSQHAIEEIFFDRELSKQLRTAPPLTFTKF